MTIYITIIGFLHHFISGDLEASGIMSLDVKRQDEATVMEWKSGQ